MINVWKQKGLVIALTSVVLFCCIKILSVMIIGKLHVDLLTLTVIITSGIATLGVFLFTIITRNRAWNSNISFRKVILSLSLPSALMYVYYRGFIVKYFPGDYTNLVDFFYSGLSISEVTKLDSFVTASHLIAYLLIIVTAIHGAIILLFLSDKLKIMYSKFNTMRVS